MSFLTSTQDITPGGPPQGQPTDLPMERNTSLKARAMVVPAEAVAIDGATPVPGDPVDAQISGTVHGLDGDQVVIYLESINGVPVNSGGDGGEEGEMSMLDMARREYDAMAGDS